MLKYRIFILEHRTYCINSLGDSLAQLGHKIYVQSSWRQPEVEAGIKYFRPHILLTIGYNKPLFNRWKNSINPLCKKYNLFHIYWATEDEINHMEWSMPYVLATKPDLIWTIHPNCIQRYRQLGFACSYFNFAFNPLFFPEKPPNANEIYDVSLVGATHLLKKTYRYESLKMLLFPLVKEGIRVDIWGYGWKKNKDFINDTFGLSIPDQWLHGHILYGKTVEIYHQSKIVLGLQNSQTQITQRTFEILGTGAFMIADDTPALNELCVRGREAIFTTNPTETGHLVKHYLNHPDIRHTIGSLARKMILAKHTYIHRINNVWGQLESLIEGRKLP